MKFAITVSSYLLPEFVKMNLIMCRHVFGQDAPLMVSDDRSANSKEMSQIASDFGAAYSGSDKRRGHFAADLQSIVNSIVFARATGADVAVKISFRLILLDKTLKDMFIDRFENHLTKMICPCKVQPNQLLRRESMTFTMLPILSDVILLKTDAIHPQELINLYRHKISTEKVQHASLIEALIFDLHVGRFNNCSYISDELGKHQPGQPHRFLRKCQNHRQQYIDLARHLGMSGDFRTDEWSRLEGVNYRPRPILA